MTAGPSRPALIVVSGPPGAGKTTLAREIARAIGCPAVCRDEIKEGMVHATPGFVPKPGDELAMRTLPAFFGVLEVLLLAGVTTVAEAAFQDRVWRPHLVPLRPLARTEASRYREHIAFLVAAGACLGRRAERDRTAQRRADREREHCFRHLRAPRFEAGQKHIIVR